MIDAIKIEKVKIRKLPHRMKIMINFTGIGLYSIVN